MWELYLLTRLGVIFPTLVITAAIAGIISVVAGIDIVSEGEVERSTKIFKRSAVTLAISIIGIIFIPTKEDILLIYGVGTTLDYLQNNEKVQQLPGNEGGVWEADIKDLRPIPITKEILKKAGFSWDGCYGHKQLDEDKTMQYYKHESRLRVWYKMPEEIIFECHGIHHLHQLQNAYYMATGEELEVQP